MSRRSRERSSASTSIDTTKVAGCVVVPLDLDDPVGLGRERRGVGAVGAVHRHAAAAGDEAHDLVAGHRRAAPRQADHDVVEALDVHADRARGARAWRAARRSLRGDGQLLLAARAARCWSRWATALRRHVALADRRVQRVEVGVVHRLGDGRRAPATFASFWTGRPSRRSALASSSRPVSIASTRRSRENHWRIFALAFGVCDELQPVAARARALRPCW